MKKMLGAVLGLALAVAASPAMAASISNLSGQSCGAQSGGWHFVNNQTGGAAPGQLTATWSSGDQCIVGPSAVNAKTQHFNCQASGQLLTASTNLPGKLVLSDFTCSQPPKTEDCKNGIDDDGDGLIDDKDPDCKVQ